MTEKTETRQNLAQEILKIEERIGRRKATLAAWDDISHLDHLIREAEDIAEDLREANIEAFFATVRRLESRIESLKNFQTAEEKISQIRKGTKIQDLYGEWHEVFAVYGNNIETIEGKSVHATKVYGIINPGKNIFKS